MPPKQIFDDTDSDSDGGPAKKPGPAPPKTSAALSALLEEDSSGPAPASKPTTAAKFHDSDGEEDKSDKEEDWEKIETASPKSSPRKAAPVTQDDSSDSEDVPSRPAAVAPAPAAPRAPPSPTADSSSEDDGPPAALRKPAPRKPPAKAAAVACDDDSDSSSSDLVPGRPQEAATGTRVSVQLREQLHEIQALFAGGFRAARLYEMGAKSLPSTHLRSVYWKLYLGLLSLPPDGASLRDTIQMWETHVESARSLLQISQDRHTVDKRCVDDDDEEALVKDNPLAQGGGGTWDQRFAQKEVEKEITKDLDRMSSEDQLLERADVRGFLFSVLRAWSLDNPDPGYRQGMHDVCSVFALHLFRDAEPLEKTPVSQMGGADEDALRMLRLVVPTRQDLKERDGFYLFNTLLTAPQCNLKAWYMVTASPRGRAGAAGSGGPSSDTPVVRQSRVIQETLLPKRDPKLGAHLAKLGIEPTTYGLRWLRLWFIREFDIVKASKIWDAVLAEVLLKNVEGTTPEVDSDTPLSLGLLPHVACAMLCYLSQDLLQKEFPMAMRRMMRYPPVESTSIFVERALSWSKSPLLKYTDIVPDEEPLRPAPGYPPVRKPAPKQQKQESPKAGSRNRDLGDRLSKAIDTFEAMWFTGDADSGQDRAKQVEDYMLAVADLKLIRDQLLFPS